MISTIIIYFAIYSFLGWGCETIYCSISDRKFVNRGFLHGPFCPIYGCGALTVLFIVSPIHENFLFIFIFGALAASIIEYITSYLLELIFQLKLWDYSDYRYNLNGRVCLKNSTMFGILSVLLHFIIHPEVKELLSALSEPALRILSIFIVIYFCIDAIISTGALLKFKTQIEHLHILMQTEKAALQRYKDELDQKRLERAEELKEKARDIAATINRLKQANPYTYRRITSAFPKMHSKKHPYSFEKIIKEIKQEFDNRKLR